MGDLECSIWGAGDGGGRLPKCLHGKVDTTISCMHTCIAGSVQCGLHNISHALSRRQRHTNIYEYCDECKVVIYTNDDDVKNILQCS